MRFRPAFCFLVLAAGLAAQLLAQPTISAKISGRAVGADGLALPGVTVLFHSTGLQGTRRSETGGSGRYVSPPLPPGVYEVVFELEGFQTARHRKRVFAGSTAEVDARLEIGSATDTITVVGDGGERISESSTAGETLSATTLEELGVLRSPGSAAFHSAGNSGLGLVAISGGHPSRSLSTLDGAVISDNRSGSRRPVYIEDAILETTTYTSGVSAEFGRFTGGVVNAVTRSGGNELAGSFRLGLDNPSWSSGGRFRSADPPDVTNETYQATLGGPLSADRLWFFLAGHDRVEDLVFDGPILGLPFPERRDDQRFEVKLTAALTPSHHFRLAHTTRDRTIDGVAHDNQIAPLIPDDGSQSNARFPERLTSLSWLGLPKPDLSLEALYSERGFSVIGSGGSDRNLASGSPILDGELGVAYHASFGCGVCPPRELDNENFFVKGSHYRTFGQDGSHEISFGYELFRDITRINDFVSATDFFTFSFIPSILTADSAYPRFLPGASALLYDPVLEPSRGTDFRVGSYFVNDRLHLGDRWSFNLGLRFDDNDGRDAAGALVADTSELSPRLGVTFRPGVEGPWLLHATSGRYIAAIDNSIANAGSAAGRPAEFGFLYFGDPINPGSEPETGPLEANQQLIDWVLELCPDLRTNPGGCPTLIVADYPGVNLQVRPGLAPPSADELTVGAHRTLRRGALRGDLVYRDFQNDYMLRRDTTTGRVSDPLGGQFDLGVLENDSRNNRKRYLGLHLSYHQSLLDSRLQLNGNLTWSSMKGNVGHEVGFFGGDLLEYPEYKEARWYSPYGEMLYNHMDVVARFWATAAVVDTPRQRLNVTTMQSHFDGFDYTAAGLVQSAPYVDNPGYVTPPFVLYYHFTQPGALETDAFDRTDLSLNYYFEVGNATLFVQGHLLNAFNEIPTWDDDTVFTAFNDATLEPFNPFTEEPVEGVHWRKGSDFGEPAFAIGDSRSWRFSLGVRFRR